MQDMYHPLRIKFKLKDLMKVPGTSMVRMEHPYLIMRVNWRLLPKNGRWVSIIILL